MKTVQEGKLGEAYKRALDTANTRAVYVSFDDAEQTAQAVDNVFDELESSEEQIQALLDQHGSSVLLIAFDPDEPLAEIAQTVKTFVEGDGIVAIVSPHPEIVQAVKELF